MPAANRIPDQPTIKTLFGIAKGAGVDEENLRALASRITGKDSLAALTQPERAAIADALKGKQPRTRSGSGKRTDEGGDPRTVKQRRKIYMLCQDLGWNNDPRRIHAFCKRMTGAERIEWLSPYQCSKVIEALKDMVAREEAQRDRSGRA